MTTTQAFRFTIAGLFMALITLTAPMAQANCGSCGTKKECPSPTPAPSPAK
ncbi:MAG: hypothetical protein K8R57_09025 [Verrucomicrobia bacterium]|nr:hypothetical protein [Verrucomicrobiota bacterium]